MLRVSIPRMFHFLLQHILSRPLTTRASSSPTRANLKLATAVMSCSTLAGCTGALNQSDGPIGVTLPALQGETTATGLVANTTSITPNESSPWSSRASWSVVTVNMPSAETETFPFYRSPLLNTNGDWREIFTSPIHAGFDLAVMPVRMIQVPPTTTLRCPNACSCCTAVSAVE